MTGESVTSEAHLTKFQGLLRELFQFDCADLDFGIYRIMNHKRDVVERFVKAQGFADGADALYINWGSVIPGAKAIEPLFEARMFAGIHP